MSLAPILQLPSVRNVPSHHKTTDHGAKHFLTEPEMTRLLQAAKQGRYGVRDHALLLVGYRHGYMRYVGRQNGSQVFLPGEGE